MRPRPSEATVDASSVATVGLAAADDAAGAVRGDRFEVLDFVTVGRDFDLLGRVLHNGLLSYCGLSFLADYYRGVAMYKTASPKLH